MLLDFGAATTRLVDKPGNQETIAKFFIAISSALRPRVVDGRQLGEPGFRLSRMTLIGAEPGLYTFDNAGIFYPRGHLGDFSESEAANVVVGIPTT